MAGTSSPSCARSRYARGEPHVLQIARDITASRTADARLRASEEQYRAIFNASVDAMILWNSRFQRVDVNPPTNASTAGRATRSSDVATMSRTSRRIRKHKAELVQRALAGEAASAVLEAVRKDGAHITTR